MKDKISMTRKQFDELDRLILRAAECTDSIFKTVIPKLSLHEKAENIFFKIGKLLKDVKDNCTKEISKGNNEEQCGNKMLTLEEIKREYNMSSDEADLMIKSALSPYSAFQIVYPKSEIEAFLKLMKGNKND
jgi:hypothetical protein